MWRQQKSLLSFDNWKHRHDYSVSNEKGEKRTLYVLALTAATMIVEITAGSVYGSMAFLADAVTSLLAIVALLAGKFLGWNWLDSTMGIIGALIITHWAYGLLAKTVSVRKV